MSIGEVLKALREEFSDVSISKIRFLETEGLVDPERTPSGYRKFYPDDLARLRYILRAQRDHFMPLKVIRKKLETFDPAEDIQSGAGSNHSEALPPVAGLGGDDGGISIEGGVNLSWEEFLNATGLSPEEVTELEEYGLMDSHLLDSGDLYYNEDDLQVGKIAREFGKYGIQARHLKMYKNFAEKEVGLFEQAILPSTRRRSGEGVNQQAQSMAELARLSKRLKQALLRSCLQAYLSN